MSPFITPSAARPLHLKRSWPKRIAAAIVGAALVALVALGLVLVPPPGAASAAAYGPGFDDADNGGMGRIGAYLVEDGLVYCLEPLLDRPLGTTTAAGPLDASAFEVTPGTVAAVNWAISTHGQADDPIVTSAVALFVWSAVAAEDLASVGADVETQLRRVPEAHREAVMAQLEAIRTEAAIVEALRDEPLTGGIELLTDERGPSLTVRSSDETATAAIVLEGAVFDTGSSTGQLSSGEVAPISVGREFTGDQRPTVRATGTLSSGIERWRATLESFETPNAQLLGGAGGMDRPTLELGAKELDMDAPGFRPTIDTRVGSRTVEIGAPFVDVWTPRTAGVDWPREGDGTFAEVLATATLYGPFDAEPSQTVHAPAEAPVAATLAAAVGGGLDDPTGRPVSVSTGDLTPPVVAVQPGHYVWVIEIAAGQQTDNHSLADEYAWRHDFGVPSEMSHVPTTATVATDAGSTTPTPPAASTSTATPTPTPTPTPTESAGPLTPTATPTPIETESLPSPSLEPGQSPTESGPNQPDESNSAPPAAPDNEDSTGLAQTGGSGGPDWLVIIGIALVSGGCLVAAAAIKRADARADMRREAARR